MPHLEKKNKKTPGKRICPACLSENPAGSRYCSNCATTLISPKDPDGGTQTGKAATVEISRGDRIAVRYEIVEELGRGGMGRVFRVFDHQVGEVVALKLIRADIGADDKAIERFRNELKFTRKIAHRNICRMYDLGEEGPFHFITMEYVPGENLKRFIRRAGPLNAGKVVYIAKQVCEGLVEAHRAGAVHRDLKPQNIMIDAEGAPKIMDFGIARFMDMDRVTRSGVMIGTPEYMSPEQVDMIEVDKRADIYALGCVLFEMVTGRVPFEGETPIGVALKHKTERPRSVLELNPQVQPSLAAVIAKCLEKDPARRYQDAAALRDALSAVEMELTTAEIVAPPDLLKISSPALRPPAPESAGTWTALQPNRVRMPGAPPSDTANMIEELAAGVGRVQTQEGPTSKTATMTPEIEGRKSPGPGRKIKPVFMAAGILGLAATAVVLFFIFGKKTPDLPSDPARAGMEAAKVAASGAGLANELPIMRVARSFEDEAVKLASDGNFREAVLAFGAAERLYRVCVELPSDEQRLEKLRGGLVDARAAADAAVQANPDDARLKQALALDLEGQAATIKKQVEEAARAMSRATFLYESLRASFEAGGK